MALRARLGLFVDWAFWLWALVGAGLAFGMLSFAGFFVGLGCIVFVVRLARDPRTRPAWLGVLVGAGALPLLIAYINREGPGWKWLGLIAVGLIGHPRRSRPPSATAFRV